MGRLDPEPDLSLSPAVHKVLASPEFSEVSTQQLHTGSPNKASVQLHYLQLSRPSLHLHRGSLPPLLASRKPPGLQKLDFISLRKTKERRGDGCREGTQVGNEPHTGTKVRGHMWFKILKRKPGEGEQEMTEHGTGGRGRAGL